MIIKGLVFDFDGLILDTEYPEFETWQEIYKEHGGNLDVHDYAICLGTYNSPFDPIRHLQEQIGASLDGTAIREQFRIRALEHIIRQTALPGVHAILQQAHELHLGTALASSSDHRWVVGHLDRLGLTQEFEFIFTREDVLLAKPDPELFLKAIQALGIQPEEAIAFEDSPNGIAAAKAAGIFCVAIPNRLTTQLDTSHADLHLQQLDELTLPQLEQRLIDIRNLQSQ
jgi:HAD superfamily hydrolase (TIGR01509 family)